MQEERDSDEGGKVVDGGGVNEGDVVGCSINEGDLFGCRVDRDRVIDEGGCDVGGVDGDGVQLSIVNFDCLSVFERISEENGHFDFEV